MDSNAERNNLPGASTSDAKGVWNADLVDMGENNLTMTGHCYLQIFTIASS